MPSVRRHGQSPSQPERLPRIVWVLVTAAFVIALGYGIVAPVLPQLAHSFGVSLAAASAIVSAFALLRLLFAPIAGRMVTKMGEQPVYLIGLLVVALSTGACALADSYWSLLVLRAAGGVGSAMFTVSAMGLLVRVSPPRLRARVSSLYSGGFLIGGIAGPVLGAVVAHWGIRAPFIVYAVALVVATAVVAVNVRVGVHIGGRADADAGAPADGPDAGAHSQTSGDAVRPLMSLGAALRDSRYRAAIFNNLANGWASFGVRVSVVPLYVAVVLSHQAGMAGYVLTAFAVGNAAVLFPAGRWSDKHGRKLPLALGMLVAGVGMGAMGFTGSLTGMLIASVVTGAGIGMVSPSQQAIVADVVGTRARAGQVLAVFQMAGDCGAVLGPIVVGALADAFGFGVAFWACGALLLAASLVWMVTRVPAPVASPHPTASGSM